MREEGRLRVFENRVLKTIFGTRKSEVTGEWRRMYDNELCDLYSSPNIFQLIKTRRIRWAGMYGRHERRIQGFDREA